MEDQPQALRECRAGAGDEKENREEYLHLLKGTSTDRKH